MDKKPIRLTEQDLHFLVENAVRTYLTEMDEDFKSGVTAAGRQIKNGIQGWWRNRGENQGNSQQVQQPKGNFATRLGNGLTKASQAVTNVGKAYGRGSANGDAQKYINNAVKALQDLQTADDTMVRNGGKGIGNKNARKAIENALAYLDQSQGGYNMRNRFNGSVDQF